MNTRNDLPGDGALNDAGPPPKPAPTIHISAAPTEQPGDRIGRYKLLQLIGEGGCGAVYMAEQQEPVRRRVALKVIKLGMDTRQVIARFEAERQALALMDHPNIATVLDAGATESGRPYFVMELVRGIKITEYCDQNRLDTEQRLSLFLQVCQAIQHAYSKGIIHRDIKPSNILVTMHDGVPVPKVIDFGIAKATTNQPLTDKTLFTAYEQFIGTPAYMSPEQAEMSGLDIDTRSDVYSLGVLLYELLTGRTPFDPKELMKSGLDAMRKTIREDEPPRPSTKLDTLEGDDSTTTARAHGTEMPKLISVLRGDLDWIVMKCLEKDRTRRYESVNGLTLDLQRHISNEPVIARPPSKLYRFQKMVQRNKSAFTAAAAVLGILCIGLGVSVWLLRREREAQRANLIVRQRFAAEERARIAEQQRREEAQREAAQWKAAAEPVSARLFHPEKPLPDYFYARRSDSDLQGCWLGTVEYGSIRRDVSLRIAEVLPELFAADLYDQLGNPTPITDLTYIKPNLKIDFLAALEGHYKGTLSPDGTELTGTLTQRGGGHPLILKRVAALDFHPLPKDESAFGFLGETELQGIWRASVSNGPTTLHLVVRITKRAGGYRTWLDFNELKGIPGTASFQGGAARLEWSFLGVSFKGKLERGQLNGNLEPGGEPPLPLRFLRDTSVAAAGSTNQLVELENPLPDSAYAPRRDSDLQGSWFGTTMSPGGNTLRFGIKLAEVRPGKFAAQCFSPDKTARPIPVTELSYAKRHLSFSLELGRGLYQGTLAPDGSEISGTWTDAVRASPFIFKRVERIELFAPPPAPVPPSRLSVRKIRKASGKAL